MAWNCFAAEYDGQVHPISLDNDCLGGGGNSYMPEYLHCAFFARELRKRFMDRLDALRASFPGVSSPVRAAVLASISEAVLGEHSQSMLDVIIDRLTHGTHKKGNPSGPPWYWGNSGGDPGIVVTIDRVASKMYDSFSRCSGD